MDLTAAHIGFVLIAYGLTFAVLVGLIAAIAMDLRAQRAALARLEDTGASRRRRAPAHEAET